MTVSQPSAIDAVASIRHDKAISSGAVVVTIKPRRGYHVSLMVGAEVQVFVYADDGGETVMLKLDPPKPNQVVKVNRYPEGEVRVVYS